MISVFVGWGVRKHGDYYTSNQLLEVQVPVWEDDVCRRLEAPHPFNGEKQICAGPQEGGQGFCQVICVLAFFLSCSLIATTIKTYFEM